VNEIVYKKKKNREKKVLTAKGVRYEGKIKIKYKKIKYKK
jgi:hypothetical protein